MWRMCCRSRHQPAVVPRPNRYRRVSLSYIALSRYLCPPVISTRLRTLVMSSLLSTSFNRVSVELGALVENFLLSPHTTCLVTTSVGSNDEDVETAKTFARYGTKIRRRSRRLLFYLVSMSFTMVNLVCCFGVFAVCCHVPQFLSCPV